MGSKKLKKKIKKVGKILVPISSKKIRKIAVPIGAIALATTGALVKPIVSAVTTKVIKKKLTPTPEAPFEEPEIPETQVISMINREIATRSTGDGQLKEVSPYLINPALSNPIIPVSDLGTATNVKKELQKGAQFLTPARLATAQQIGIDIPEDIQAEVSKIQMPVSPKPPEATTTPKLMLPLLIAGGIGIGALVLTKKQ